MVGVRVRSGSPRGGVETVTRRASTIDLKGTRAMRIADLRKDEVF